MTYIAKWDVVSTTANVEYAKIMSYDTGTRASDVETGLSIGAQGVAAGAAFVAKFVKVPKVQAVAYAVQGVATLVGFLARFLPDESYRRPLLSATETMWVREEVGRGYRNLEIQFISRRPADASKCWGQSAPCSCDEDSVNFGTVPSSGDGTPALD